MLYTISYLFLFFLTYSIIGYIIEVSDIIVTEKRLELNRGFLIGPIIPIYGIGSMIMECILGKYRDDYLILFLISMFICSFLEYFTSFILEKMFKMRWWDYSHIKYNINGRICVLNAVLFGIGGIIFIKYINPFLLNLLQHIPKNICIILSIILFILFLIDFIISLIVVIRLKINVDKFTSKDSTKEIKKEVAKSMKSMRGLTIRLLKAFPLYLSSKSSKWIRYILFNSKDELKKLKEEYKKKKKSIRNKYKKKK